MFIYLSEYWKLPWLRKKKKNSNTIFISIFSEMTFQIKLSSFLYDSLSVADLIGIKNIVDYHLEIKT